MRESNAKDGLLHQFYLADLYKGIKLDRVGGNINFKAELEQADYIHALEALNMLPDYVKVSTILTILGAVLQEQVVVIHSED